MQYKFDKLKSKVIAFMISRDEANFGEIVTKQNIQFMIPRAG